MTRHELARQAVHLMKRHTPGALHETVLEAAIAHGPGRPGHPGAVNAIATAIDAGDLERRDGQIIHAATAAHAHDAWIATQVDALIDAGSRPLPAITLGGRP